MIPVEQKRDVSTSGAEGSASFEISGKNAAHIMTILRDTLYSDKVLAVLREYAANAWDANRSIGRGDQPIEVTLPTYSDAVLKIRDHGPGLSEKDVFTVYNQYGESTKRGSNVEVGMLGIGSKSAFAYSDSFTIISWNGGLRATYVAVIDASEKGRVDLLDVADCDASETGVEIQIAVKPQDINEFTTKAQTLFAYFNPQPKINTTLPPLPKGKSFPKDGLIVESVDRYAGGGSWVAIMGCVPYRINMNQLTGLSPSARNLSGYLNFDIGGLQVAASREELKYGDSTKEMLVERINGIVDKYVAYLLEGIDKLTPWDRRLRIRQIKNMYLTVPSDLKHLEETYLSFKADPMFTLKSRGWKGKMSAANGFKVGSTTRLVFRDEKKLLTGYQFQPDDVIVDPTVDAALARVALNKQVIDTHVLGITIVNISTIPWVRPASAPRQVDAARSRASCLILDPKSIHKDRKSERWTPVVRTPLDTDVYVILDSYVVDDLADFYESFENDLILLEAAAIGGKMPAIIGYRHTKANPVDRSKIKGTDYKVWRQAPYTKLLLANQQVADGLAARIWSNVNSYGISQQHIDKIGADHPVGQFMMKAMTGRLDYQRVKREYQGAVSRAFYQVMGDSIAQKEWLKLVERYPLLATAGNTVTIFAEPHAEKWVGYIKMVDFYLEMTENFQEEQAA